MTDGARETTDAVARRSYGKLIAILAGRTRNAHGEFVPLAEQDQTQWDWDRGREAEALLLRAGAFRTIGRYQLEAALQSAHVHRCRTGDANWAEVVQLYDVLLAITDSPVVALNRAVAIGQLEGPAAASGDSGLIGPERPARRISVLLGRAC